MSLASLKSAEARQAAKEERASVNQKQFNESQLAAKKKAEGAAEAEIDKFFKEQEALQDEARQAFRKYDADNSGAIDADELKAVLADMNFFEGMDATAQDELVQNTLKEVDTNNDGVLNFSEFTTCYNKLKTKCEEAESAGVKLPPIFGTLTPEEEARVKGIPKMLDRSVFAPRKKEAASKDYFDDVKVRDKMFKLDWGRVDKHSTFMKFKEEIGLAKADEKTGKLKATPLLKFFKTAMRTQYDMLCNCYTYYTSQDMNGAFHAMDYSEFIAFAKASGFRDTSADPKAPQKFGHMNLNALFDDLNLEDEATNKKLQKQNDANIDDAFMRFEFLELVMRLAMKFPQTEDPKAAFQGFLIFTKNNLTREARIATEDRNIFRMKRLYTPEVMSCFFNYQHELRCMYSLMIGTDFKDATTEEWLWLCKRCGVYDRHLPEDQGIHEKECTLMFSFSQMMMADEVKDREAYTTMSFTEYLEALGRLADAKDLPTKEELEQHGYKGTLDFIAEVEKLKRHQKPKIERHPDCDFYTFPEKTRPLEAHLLCLLDYMFLMLEPECGSVLLGTYDQKTLLRTLAEECKDLHGKVLFKV